MVPCAVSTLSRISRMARDYMAPDRNDKARVEDPSRTHFPTGGGCRGTLGSSSLIHAHEGAEFAQIVAVGLAISGSSKVPALKMISSGRESALLVTGVPQR